MNFTNCIHIHFMDIKLIYFFLAVLRCEIVVQSNGNVKPFILSDKCLKDNALCRREELEYIAISELHSQIDDDKNGDIDIYESNDFVKASLSYPSDSDKAKKFHKLDAHIDKQDLWNIWTTSNVYNWTTQDLVDWMDSELGLQQYVNTLNALKLNGSSMPRLTDMNYLSKVLKITNSIHRKKVMIKAIDAVLFGHSKKSLFTSKSILVTLAAFVILTIYLLIQNMFSKKSVKDMQNKINELTKEERNLSELRDKLKEAEDIKDQTVAEMQELERRHRFEISKVKSASNDSLALDPDKLKEAEIQIGRLEAALNEAHSQINDLTRSSFCAMANGELCSDGHLLQSLMQLSYAVEKQYLGERIMALEHKSDEVIELNEKIKKRKAGFLGAFRIIHSTDMDEIEKGFTTTKKAYEKVIQDKREMEWRWHKVQEITGLNVTKFSDIANIKHLLKLHFDESSSETQRSVPLSQTDHSDLSRRKFCDSMPILDQSVVVGKAHDQLSEDSLDQSKSLSSHDSSENLRDSRLKLDDDSVNHSKVRSRKEQYQGKRPAFRIGRTRIPSLTRPSTIDL